MSFEVGDSVYFLDLDARLVVVSMWPSTGSSRYRMLVPYDIYPDCIKFVDRFDSRWPDCPDRAEELRKALYARFCKWKRPMDLHITPKFCLSVCRVPLIEYAWS